MPEMRVGGRVEEARGAAGDVNVSGGQAGVPTKEGMDASGVKETTLTTVAALEASAVPSNPQDPNPIAAPAALDAPPSTTIPQLRIPPRDAPRAEKTLSTPSLPSSRSPPSNNLASVSTPALSRTTTRTTTTAADPTVAAAADPAPSTAEPRTVASVPLSATHLPRGISGTFLGDSRKTGRAGKEGEPTDNVGLLPTSTAHLPKGISTTFLAEESHGGESEAREGSLPTSTAHLPKGISTTFLVDQSYAGESGARQAEVNGGEGVGEVRTRAEVNHAGPGEGHGSAGDVMGMPRPTETAGSTTKQDAVGAVATTQRRATTRRREGDVGSGQKREPAREKKHLSSSVATDASHFTSDIEPRRHAPAAGRDDARRRHRHRHRRERTPSPESDRRRDSSTTPPRRSRRRRRRPSPDASPRRYDFRPPPWAMVYRPPRPFLVDPPRVSVARFLAPKAAPVRVRDPVERETPQLVPHHDTAVVPPPPTIHAPTPSDSPSDSHHEATDASPTLAAPSPESPAPRTRKSRRRSSSTTATEATRAADGEETAVGHTADEENGLPPKPRRSSGVKGRQSDIVEKPEPTPSNQALAPPHPASHHSCCAAASSPPDVRINTTAAGGDRVFHLELKLEGFAGGGASASVGSRGVEERGAGLGMHAGNRLAARSRCECGRGGPPPPRPTGFAPPLQAAQDPKVAESRVPCPCGCGMMVPVAAGRGAGFGGSEVGSRMEEVGGGTGRFGQFRAVEEMGRFGERVRKKQQKMKREGFLLCSSPRPAAAPINHHHPTYYPLSSAPPFDQGHAPPHPPHVHPHAAELGHLLSEARQKIRELQTQLSSTKQRTTATMTLAADVDDSAAGPSPPVTVGRGSPEDHRMLESRDDEERHIPTPPLEEEEEEERGPKEIMYTVFDRADDPDTDPEGDGGPRAARWWDLYLRDDPTLNLGDTIKFRRLAPPPPPPTPQDSEPAKNNRVPLVTLVATPSFMVRPRSRPGSPTRHGSTGAHPAPLNPSVTTLVVVPTQAPLSPHPPPHPRAAPHLPPHAPQLSKESFRRSSRVRHPLAYRNPRVWNAMLDDKEDDPRHEVTWDVAGVVGEAMRVQTKKRNVVIRVAEQRNEASDGGRLGVDSRWSSGDTFNGDTGPQLATVDAATSPMPSQDLFTPQPRPSSPPSPQALVTRSSTPDPDSHATHTLPYNPKHDAYFRTLSRDRVVPAVQSAHELYVRRREKVRTDIIDPPEPRNDPVARKQQLKEAAGQPGSAQFKPWWRLAGSMPLLRASRGEGSARTQGARIGRPGLGPETEGEWDEEANLMFVEAPCQNVKEWCETGGVGLMSSTEHAKRKAVPPKVTPPDLQSEPLVSAKQEEVSK
ncbi:hypothetical protein HDU96_004605 [Phlyctochytrium bullatum]|nr:hypothetical protein HDU96_004605 [Phlyctochytrium bullatum]